MINITGFEPLDIVIMESSRKMFEVRDLMQEFNLKLDDALAALGYDYEDFISSDLKTLMALDK